MQLELTVTGSDPKAPIDVAERTFGQALNESLIHQVVNAYMSTARSGTRAQKSRSEVRGGGAKPWRQKGSGRARAGSNRSPLWRGGGVTFAAKPGQHRQKVNRKAYRAAMRSILSELAREGRLLVVEEFAVSQPKTRDLVAKLKELKVNDVLIITADRDDTLSLSARNLHRVDVTPATALDPVSLLSFERILMTVPALRRIEERFA